MNNFEIKDFDTLIFDFDGTLLDSEPYHKLAHSKVLSYILGKEINLTDKDFERYIGKKDTEIFEMYKKDFNVDFDSEKMIDKKVEMARDLLLEDEVKIFDYFFNLISQKGNRKFYIVSNQHEKILYSVLKQKNIMQYFDDVFCLSKMNVKKDLFYRSIEKYINNPQKIAVFEDDSKVLRFLKELNYVTVGVENQMNCGKLIGCDYLISTKNTDL